MTGLPQLRVLYDGDCGLCDRSVRFLFRRERRARFVFTPIQSVLGRRLAGELGLDPSDPASFALIEEPGAAHLRSRGMFLALAHCRQPWRLLASIAGCLPRFVTDRVYDVVARHRIAWFGRPSICQRPEPGLLERLETGP
jgi:predicted DCC family thiol-disulfide oxidoreductase YuxK